MVRVEIGFYIEAMVWPLLKSLHRIHVLLAYQYIDRSSYELLLSVLGIVGFFRINIQMTV